MAVKRKLKTLRRTVESNQPLDDLLRRVNSTLQGWAGYFRAGVSSATFSYLSHYTWQTVWRWLRRKHRKSTWKQLRRRYCGGGWWPATEDRVLIDLEKITTTRYRYRGAVISRPGQTSMRTTQQPDRVLWRARCIERCTPGSGSGPGKRNSHNDCHRVLGRLSPTANTRNSRLHRRPSRRVRGRAHLHHPAISRRACGPEHLLREQGASAVRADVP